MAIQHSRFSCLFSLALIHFSIPPHLLAQSYCNLFVFKDFICFQTRGREGERVGQKHQCVVASCGYPPTEDLACNPGMCPDQDSNWQPFVSQASTQATELHQPGHLAQVILDSSCIFHAPVLQGTETTTFIEESYQETICKYLYLHIQ